MIILFYICGNRDFYSLKRVTFLSQKQQYHPLKPLSPYKRKINSQTDTTLSLIEIAKKEIEVHAKIARLSYHYCYKLCSVRFKNKI